MKRREFICSLTAGLVVSRHILAHAARTSKSDKPNFVFVIGDDCTHRDIGCYGGQAHTPNIDKLAKQGMRFKQCFQAAPMCSPTRHNIYTGLYPVKSGAYPNHTFAKDGTQSIVHYLKPLGYRVALSGKQHIKPPGVFPFEYSGVKNNPDPEAVESLFKECSESDTPFCLFACSNEPHSPWNKGDSSRYDPAKLELPAYFVDTEVTRKNYADYLAEITYLDGQVGMCVELLDKYKLADNTMVIFTSEQGASFPFGKWTCYDTGLQTAFVVRWPGKVKAGTVSDAMIEYVDVTPTFVEAAGGKPADVLDGESILPVLFGKKKEHKDYVYGLHTTRGIINGSDHYGIRSVRSKNFKYVVNLTPEVTFTNACTKSSDFVSWVEKAKTDPDAADKVRRYQHRPAEELYDVTKDKLEWTNLADNPEYAQIKADLRKRLFEWMESQGDKGQQTELEALEHQAKNRNKAATGSDTPKKRKKKAS